MWVLKKSKLKSAQESKQKQIHVRKSYKHMNQHCPALIGNSEGNIDLCFAFTYSAGQMNAQPKTEKLFFFLSNQSFIK